LLAKAVNERPEQAVGAQTGGRIFLFLHTDDFRRDYAACKERGGYVVEEPRQEPYGTVAVFTDLYGNRWDLIEPKADYFFAAQPRSTRAVSRFMGKKLSMRSSCRVMSWGVP